ncbi:MAG: hypothetical protein H5T75_03280 [Coriobacteriia bacterium]|nr:hypothetical protein [Coriobacteriia bacterium]
MSEDGAEDGADLSPEEAIAFVESLRLMSRGRAGFQWLDAKLEELERSVRALAKENRRLKAFIESQGYEDDLARWSAHDADDV